MTDVIVNELVTVAEVIESATTIEVNENGHTVLVDTSPSIAVQIVESPVTVIVQEIIGDDNNIEQGAVFTYDANGNVIRLDYDNGAFLDMTYTQSDNLLTVSNGVWIKTFHYNGGNLESITIN